MIATLLFTSYFWGAKSNSRKGVKTRLRCIQSPGKLIGCRLKLTCYSGSMFCQIRTFNPPSSTLRWHPPALALNPWIIAWTQPYFSRSRKFWLECESIMQLHVLIVKTAKQYSYSIKRTNFDTNCYPRPGEHRICNDINASMKWLEQNVDLCVAGLPAESAPWHR